MAVVTRPLPAVSRKRTPRLGATPRQTLFCARGAAGAEFWESLHQRRLPRRGLRRLPDRVWRLIASLVRRPRGSVYCHRRVPVADVGDSKVAR